VFHLFELAPVLSVIYLECVKTKIGDYMYRLLRYYKENVHVAHDVYLCALYDSHSKHLFSETAVVFVIAAHCALCE
jgi:UDP-glucose 4-epimerase